MNNLLIYGGSFDPPHLGHLNTALNVQQHFHFQSFIFLPCKAPILKHPTWAPNSARLDMLKTMLSQYPEFSISTREIDRETPSYMTETLAAYRNELGSSTSITLMLGMDAFLSLPRWHAWKEIPTLCNLLIIERQEESKPKMPDSLKELLQHQCDNPLDLKTFSHGKIAYFDAGHYPVSSTALRQKIKLNADVRNELPPEVVDYIKHHELYQ